MRGFVNSAEEGIIELTTELSSGNSVIFDPDNAILEGIYTDELCAFRAKKVWKEILEHHFLLDENHDFFFKISGDISQGQFTLKCEFKTACGRYTFWRLTNSQSPEAQYSLETAHIPNVESLHQALLGAPDLSRHKATRFIELDESFPEVSYSSARLASWIKTLLKK